MTCMEIADVRTLSNCQLENHPRLTFIRTFMSPPKGSAPTFCSNTSEVAAAGAEGTEAKFLSADSEDGKKRKLQ